MDARRESEFVVTTLGELIEALSDAALELCDDRRRAYLLASVALEEILKGSGLREEESAGSLSHRIVYH